MYCDCPETNDPGHQRISSVTPRSDSILESDVNHVELFRLTFEIFRRRFDGVIMNFTIPTSIFFDDGSEFSVTSFYVVFIFSSKSMLIFLQSVFYRNYRAVVIALTVLLS